MKTASAEKRDHPDIVALPPLIYAAFLGAALLVQWAWPLEISSAHRFLWRPGAFMVVAAVLLVLWAKRALDRAHTNIHPHRPTTSIVCDGPFRFSRNPIYLAMTMLYLGITLLFNSWWGPILLVPLFATVHYGVIKREERYLMDKFGKRYRNYRKRVRRYL
ncbi:methyltransferase family protein [Microbulbifer sediminum]|uniref:methyltransferase family protein n=1 Tax=Microbulbifer sediminum TaxID=2904250 RepID=UPI001F444330|nr:isoprenylcysteine carboxylmethyltransferase family protein [Microbulbifer sediminum]